MMWMGSLTRVHPDRLCIAAGDMSCGWEEGVGVWIEGEFAGP
jgi:hypothetical protein